MGYGFWESAAQGVQTGMNLGLQQMQREKEEEWKQKQWDRQQERYEAADERYNAEQAYRAKRDEILDGRYEDNLGYARDRDALADERYEAERAEEMRRWDAEYKNSQRRIDEMVKNNAHSRRVSRNADTRAAEKHQIEMDRVKLEKNADTIKQLRARMIGMEDDGNFATTASHAVKLSSFPDNARVIHRDDSNPKSQELFGDTDNRFAVVFEGGDKKPVLMKNRDTVLRAINSIIDPEASWKGYIAGVEHNLAAKDNATEVVDPNSGEVVAMKYTTVDPTTHKREYHEVPIAEWEAGPSLGITSSQYDKQLAREKVKADTDYRKAQAEGKRAKKPITYTQADEEKLHSRIMHDLLLAEGHDPGNDAIPIPPETLRLVRGKASALTQAYITRGRAMGASNPLEPYLAHMKQLDDKKRAAEREAAYQAERDSHMGKTFDLPQAPNPAPDSLTPYLLGDAKPIEKEEEERPQLYHPGGFGLPR